MAQCSRHNYQPLNLTVLFRSNSESLILFETAPAATFLHRRPLYCSSNYQSCTGDHLPAPSRYQQIPVLHQQLPAPHRRLSQQKQLPVLHQQLPALHRRLSQQKQLPVLHQQLPALHRRPSCSSDSQFCISSCRSWTSDHLLAPADTSPKPATIFLDQRKPVLHQRPSMQRILVLYQLSRPAPATRSCSNDHHPASAIVRCTLFRLRFAIIKFGLRKQHPCFVILA